MMAPRPPDLANPENDDHGVIRLHAPIARELEEPKDGFEPTPLWWVFGVMALLGWGGWYLGTYSGNWRPDVYDEHPGLVATSVGASAPQVDPLVLGKRLYANCQACHQAGGQGVEGNYPPLAGSEWVTGDPQTMVRILLHGAQGGLEVRGKTYNQAMPAWKHLKDEQLAAVVTYVRGSWGNTAAPVSTETVAEVRAATSDRTQPWTMGELRLAGQEIPQVAAAGSVAGR